MTEKTTKPARTKKATGKRPAPSRKPLPAKAKATAETGAERPVPEQDAKGRFVSGNSGGGRPKGSRNKLGEAFLDDLYADWEQHGQKVIEAVRATKPDVYMKVVASILPKDLNVNINTLEAASDEELLERLRDLESVIRPFIGDTGSNRDQERAGTQTAH